MTNWLTCWLVVNLILTFISLLVFIGPFLQSRSQTESRAFFRQTILQEGANTAFAVVLVVAWKLGRDPEAQSILDRVTLYLQAFLKVHLVHFVPRVMLTFDSFSHIRPSSQF